MCHISAFNFEAYIRCDAIETAGDVVVVPRKVVFTGQNQRKTTTARPVLFRRNMHKRRGETTQPVKRVTTFKARRIQVEEVKWDEGKTRLGRRRKRAKFLSSSLSLRAMSQAVGNVRPHPPSSSSRANACYCRLR